MKLSKIDSPKKFYEAIPENVEQNKKFRENLHLNLLARDKSAQTLYLEMCRQYLPIMFSSLFWTLNPQNKGSRNVPFILWPKQVKVVDELDKALKLQQYDFGIEKTRKQGATEIVAKTFAAHTILYEWKNFIVGSRKSDYVDKAGDLTTIFAKIDHVFKFLPPWMIDYRESAEKGRKNQTLFMDITNSAINGETTNENFSAGSRATGEFLDEFGRVEKRVANAIEDSVHDVCNCVVYGSTHWYGPNHPFNQALLKDTTHVETLFWWEHGIPHKEVDGLYRTPEHGIVEIIDENYWRQKYPDLIQYAV